jgi:ketosteroid isomerase-like protein
VTDPIDVVRSFNDAINGRDLDALASLMTSAHRFVDVDGATADGRPACVEAWRGFFSAYPDYRNHFDDVDDLGGGVVAVGGRSACSVAALDGPARWRAVVVDGLVDVWQVVGERPEAASPS